MDVARQKPKTAYGAIQLGLCTDPDTEQYFISALTPEFVVKLLARRPEHLHATEESLVERVLVQPKPEVPAGWGIRSVPEEERDPREMAKLAFQAGKKWSDSLLSQYGSELARLVGRSSFYLQTAANPGYRSDVYEGFIHIGVKLTHVGWDRDFLYQVRHDMLQSAVEHEVPMIAVVNSWSSKLLEGYPLCAPDTIGVESDVMASLFAQAIEQQPPYKWVTYRRKFQPEGSVHSDNILSIALQSPKIAYWALESGSVEDAKDHEALSALAITLPGQAKKLLSQGSIPTRELVETALDVVLESRSKKVQTQVTAYSFRTVDLTQESKEFLTDQFFNKPEDRVWYKGE